MQQVLATTQHVSPFRAHVYSGFSSPVSVQKRDEPSRAGVLNYRVTSRESRTIDEPGLVERRIYVYIYIYV